MPIAPITGKLRKRLFLDLTAAIGLGTAGGYAYWYGVKVPSLRTREEFYAKYEQQKQAEVPS
ncbi:hypothetical protein BOTBODRAFT_181888 [Botryobasidium botryosum FD-172 SS1]|uniref:Cytochrome c oxidase subunit 9, mitochondrial n=1 Tax=Botryobasidium botryosum (strain FD-172 SS1) TaxID=930990 RepID=A0A067LSS0_BOTB1|nr:hypothetical protein BOTBODRAFT_181888 [Botryobasidium botryosum FD-172 SS1]